MRSSSTTVFRGYLQMNFSLSWTSQSIYFYIILHRGGKSKSKHLAAGKPDSKKHLRKNTLRASKDDLSQPILNILHVSYIN